MSQNILDIEATVIETLSGLKIPFKNKTLEPSVHVYAGQFVDEDSSEIKKHSHMIFVSIIELKSETQNRRAKRTVPIEIWVRVKYRRGMTEARYEALAITQAIEDNIKNFKLMDWTPPDFKSVKAVRYDVQNKETFYHMLFETQGVVRI